MKLRRRTKREEWEIVEDADETASVPTNPNQVDTQHVQNLICFMPQWINFDKLSRVVFAFSLVGKVFQHEQDVKGRSSSSIPISSSSEF